MRPVEITDTKERLPPHVEEAVSSIAELHASHEREATAIQLATDRAIRFTGSPTALFIVLGLVVGWTLIPGIPWIGRSWFDPYPYPILDITLSVSAIAIAILILASQRRASRLTELREKMKLELAVLTEHKVTTLIRLIEDLRRDSPQIADRIDHEAQEMAKKHNHGAAVVAIEVKTAELNPEAASGQNPIGSGKE